MVGSAIPSRAGGPRIKAGRPSLSQVHSNTQEVTIHSCRGLRWIEGLRLLRNRSSVRMRRILCRISCRSTFNNSGKFLHKTLVHEGSP